MKDGTVTAVKCDVCGQPMVVRSNSKTEMQFLGCSEYPECRETQPIPASWHMREAGVAELPGFEL